MNDRISIAGTAIRKARPAPWWAAAVLFCASAPAASPAAHAPLPGTPVGKLAGELSAPAVGALLAMAGMAWLALGWTLAESDDR
jgi:hypothetical protein